MKRILILLIAAATPALGQIELLKGLKLEGNVLAGDWRMNNGQLEIAGGKGARVRLPCGSDLSNGYKLDLEFTRSEGDDVVGVILPLGRVSPVVELSAWGGEAHGMARVNGQTSKSPQNPASVRPGVLENGKRHELSIVVDDDTGVAVNLNGKLLFNWKGKVTDLEEHLVYRMPDTRCIGLVGGGSSITFHKVELTVTKQSRSPEQTAESQTTGDGSVAALDRLVETGTPGWTPFNGARFEKGTRPGSVQTVSSTGSGDRGAYMRGAGFSTGDIEVELKGTAKPQGSFIGVVFSGADGKNYEAVYFRTFNFGSSDPVRRSHAVQYVAHPEWPWRKLREERNGIFEKAVNPEPSPDEWFRARIEVRAKSVRVFVNDSKSPSLEVERLLKRGSGKVGIWFNGEGEFANFTVK